MNIKRLLLSTLSLSLIGASLTGCGEQKASVSAESTQVVKLGVVGSIYDELWKPAQEQLKSEGIELEIVQFSDYATPNNALNSGEIDLNAFQHQIYLDTEVESYGYDVQSIGYTFIIPLNLYSNKVSSVEEIKDGDIVAIPNDVTNGGRALKVLEAAGLITLKADATNSPTKDDIESYNVKIVIKELAANTIPSALPDVTAAIVNGNYALDFGLKTEEAIYKDSVLEDSIYWNLIAARTSDLSDPTKVETYEKVVEAFQTEATEKVFTDNYGGYFIKVGWDENLLQK
ncbi:MAG: MetQ/NlpA family ABC transporter substrate-binding protein [Cellulosilyticum sp.]|nr:MetQ/NlpA family ABC transporter substrate-binding protein [Cellulosilyticum sp.]